MENYKVNIPKPCQEDWNKMIPNEEGRFCKICNLSVVDFTEMSTEEIQMYFLQRNRKEVCGYYHQRQTNVSVSSFTQSIARIHEMVEKKFRFKPLRISALFLIGLVMTIIGCETNTKGKQLLQEKDASQKHQDTLKPNKVEIIGDSIMIKGKGA